MKLETEFKFNHGDVVCLKTDEGQAALLIVRSLIADVCPAGVVQRSYACRMTWRDIERIWASGGQTAKRLAKIEGELRHYAEIELVAFDPSKDASAASPEEVIRNAMARKDA